MLNFTKILPVGVEFFPADGRRDGQSDRHGEANTGFSQFCERAKKKKERDCLGTSFLHNQQKRAWNLCCCTVILSAVKL
jgi:hypothetical protein